MNSIKNDELVLATDDNFDEMLYLTVNPDVAKAVIEGRIRTGRIHFERFGRSEGRRILLRGALQEPKWKRLARQITPVAVQNWLRRFLFPNGRLPGHDRAMEEMLKDQEVLLEQLLTILRRESGFSMPPPKHLQIRVARDYSPDFIESGFSGIYPSLNRALQAAGKELKDFSTILDFGCGCGRAIRALGTLLPESKLFGTDIDAEAIEWLQRNYGRFGTFSVAPANPPTPYEDNSFDFVFGISVFTHLPEDMQFDWLHELARITKHEGYVLLTTHGEAFYSTLAGEARATLVKNGFYYSDFGFNYGKSVSLPDFYQGAFHTHDYIREHWGKVFDIVQIQPSGFENGQDTVLLRRR